MKGSNLPLDSVIESEVSRGSESDFGNVTSFSDRVLRIEVMVDSPSNSDSVITIADPCCCCCCKRRRKNGDEAANSNWTMDCSADADAVVRVKTMHVSSPILAAKSPFFCELFSTDQTHVVTLSINQSEEASVMELLNFMYRNTLNVTAAPGALLGVLIAAYKFQVSSCMRYCIRLLLNSPMTPESALLYLELPHTLLMADEVQPLIDAAKQYLADRYKDIAKFREEFMALPLSGIEAILASDDLQVASEDVVYDFVLQWARQHYNILKERQEVLNTRLARLIRFPYMTSHKLMKVLLCEDFRHKHTYKLVRKALIFKAEAPHHQWSLAAEDSVSLDRRFTQRSYKYHSIKVVEFELPRQQCVVYLDLKREECAALFPSGQVFSQAFHLGGQRYFLAAECNMDKHGSFHCFDLFVGRKKNGTGGIALVAYEFAVRCRPTEEFVVSKKKAKYKFTGGARHGARNLFATPWTSFMADDSPFFINGVLHLKAELTIRR